MKKTQTIELQQSLILSNLEALKILAVAVATGSQDDAFTAVAQIGLKTSFIAAQIAEGTYEEACAAFSMNQDEIIAASEPCANCDTKTTELSQEKLEGMLDTLEGMMGDLGINVSR